MRLTVTVVLAGALALPPSASGARRAEELPNLVPLPAFDIAIRGVGRAEPPALRFAAATANKGDFALELFGQPDEVTVESAAASQCVEWASDRVCAQRQPVGRFVWHPEHQHYHFEDFALYELRRFRADGRINLKPRGLVATSEKISFCVIDVEQDRSPSSPLYTLPHPLYYSCFAGAGFQGISPGWRDVYSSGTPGQEFPLESLVPGRFALIIHSDPDDRLFETDNDDNVSVAGIEISENLTAVDVFCVSEPGSLDCSLPAPAEG
jgi:hypothetical protein